MMANVFLNEKKLYAIVPTATISEQKKRSSDVLLRFFQLWHHASERLIPNSSPLNSARPRNRPMAL